MSTDAFLLLMLDNATLATPAFSESGILGLECVSVQIPDAPTAVDRDVYIVLRLGSFEAPIDPARVIYRTDGHEWRKYTFHGTEIDPTEILVTLAFPADRKSNPLFMDDLEMFESILAQYADLRGLPDYANHASNSIGSSNLVDSAGSQGDLRGHLVVINEVTGEVVGQFDDSRFSIKEDPKLHQRGREADPVIIEIPDTIEGGEGRTPMEMFVRTVPADQQDWIAKSATLVRYA
jgi:spartin